MPKKRLLLVLFIIISLSLMTYHSNSKTFLPLRPLTGILNFFHTVKKSISDALTTPIHRMFLREDENIRLKAELSKMIRDQQVCREALLENKRLRELLSLKENEQRYVTTARIIARSTDQWSNTLVLDKGTVNGVTKDMIAITDKGLVGKISGVFDSYAYLLLLTDINFSVSTRLQESRAEGVISGTGFRKCQLKYIHYEEEAKEGNTVITSGLDLLFPQGIPVGYVSKVNKKGTGFFQDIEVLPFVDNSKIEEVAIIKKG
jgi:rod shape-determining protein MreC